MNRTESQECTDRGAEISKAAITGRFNCFDFAGERPRVYEEELSYFVEVRKYSHAILALQSYLNENRNKSLSLLLAFALRQQSGGGRTEGGG